MTRSRVSRWAGLVAVVATLVGAPASAQTDRSVEEAYARECPRHEDTAVCRALRAAIRPLASPSPPPIARESSSEWAGFAELEGSWWQGPSEVWISTRRKSAPGTGLLNRGKFKEWAELSTYDLNGNIKTLMKAERTREPGFFRVSLTWPERWWEVTRLADGSTFFSRYNHSLIWVDKDTFDWVPGSVQQGSFVPDKTFATPASGRYARMPIADATRFTASVNRSLAARAAQQERQAAERREAFGQLLATGVAMAGVVAAGGDVDAVPLSGNPLDVLNGANAEIARQNSISRAPLEATTAGARSSGSEQASSQQGAITVAEAPSERAAASVSVREPTTTSVQAPTSDRSPPVPSAPRRCSTPGGSREWSTGMLTMIEDARAEYEEMAAWERGKGNTVGPLQCGSGVSTFGKSAAVCKATITWPEKSGSCGSQVSPQ